MSQIDQDYLNSRLKSFGSQMKRIGKKKSVDRVSEQDVQKWLDDLEKFLSQASLFGAPDLNAVQTHLSISARQRTQIMQDLNIAEDPAATATPNMYDIFFAFIQQEEEKEKLERERKEAAATATLAALAAGTAAAPSAAAPVTPTTPASAAAPAPTAARAAPTSPADATARMVRAVDGNAAPAAAATPAAAAAPDATVPPAEPAAAEPTGPASTPLTVTHKKSKLRGLAKAAFSMATGAAVGYGVKTGMAAALIGCGVTPVGWIVLGGAAAAGVASNLAVTSLSALMDKDRRQGNITFGQAFRKSFSWKGLMVSTMLGGAFGFGGAAFADGGLDNLAKGEWWQGLFSNDLCGNHIVTPAEQIQGLTDQVGQLNTDLTQAQTDAAGLQAQVNDMANQTADLKVEVAQANDTAAQAQTATAEAQAEIDRLEAELAADQADDAVAEARITELEGQVAGLAEAPDAPVGGTLDAAVAEVPDAVEAEVPDAAVAEVPDAAEAEVPDAAEAEAPEADDVEAEAPASAEVVVAPVEQAAVSGDSLTKIIENHYGLDDCDPAALQAMFPGLTFNEIITAVAEASGMDNAHVLMVGDTVMLPELSQIAAQFGDAAGDSARHAADLIAQAREAGFSQDTIASWGCDCVADNSCGVTEAVTPSEVVTPSNDNATAWPTMQLVA